jgi:hypothetical protein
VVKLKIEFKMKRVGNMKKSASKCPTFLIANRYLQGVKRLHNLKVFLKQTYACPIFLLFLGQNKSNAVI